MELFPVGRVFDFMGNRRVFAVTSLLLVGASILLLFVPGPKLGTDFRGGTEVEIGFKQPVAPSAIRQAVKAAGFSNPDVIHVQDPSNAYRYLVRVQEVSAIGEAMQREIEQRLCFGDQLPEADCPSSRQAAEVKFSPGGDKITVRFRADPDMGWIRSRMAGVTGIALRDGENNPSVQNAREKRVEIQLKSKGDQVMDGLRDALGAEKVPDLPLRVEWIGPKAGAQLRNAALTSIAIALVFVMAYIAFRFDLRFAPGAVIALAHDSLVTVGILTVIQKELTLSSVAAILTIVGYSVNDTVVVYDRVRENLGKLRGTSLPKIINVSLSEMLSRTVLTSGTTIFSLFMFFLWGTGTVKEFALTLIIGMVLGTYSSIYVALPLTDWLDRKVFERVGRRKKGPARPIKQGEAVV